MSKKSIQEVTDYKVMSLLDCMQALGWTYRETETKYEDVTCSCGCKVDLGGFIGVEDLTCPNCGKQILDITSPIPTGNATVGLIDFDEYEIEGNKYWIAIDNEGGIKLW